MEGIGEDQNLYGVIRRGTEPLWRDYNRNRTFIEGLEEEQNFYGGIRRVTETLWRD